MNEFNKTNFEELMREAVIQHNLGDYEAALALSNEAYEMAPDNSSEKGRAARDNSARYDRLGKTEEAEQWADEAFNIHDGLVKSMDDPNREAYRERSVSAMYVAVNGLRKAIHAKQAGQTVDDLSFLDSMRLTWSDLQKARAKANGLNRKIDQYAINASRRASMAETLFGDRKIGLIIGAKAVALAFASESPMLDTSNPNLTTKQRLQAKKKALLGGVAALGISVIASPKKMNKKRQKLALKIADRAL